MVPVRAIGVTAAPIGVRLLLNTLHAGDVASEAAFGAAAKQARATISAMILTTLDEIAWHDHGGDRSDHRRVDEKLPGRRNSGGSKG